MTQRNIFRREDIQNVMDAIEYANPKYTEALNVMRLALGIKTESVSIPNRPQPHEIDIGWGKSS